MRNITSKVFASLIFAAALAAWPLVQPSQADPIQWSAQGWKTAFETTSIDLARVLSGGPPRDGIPSIDDPVFKTVPEIDDLADAEPVVGLTINGDARAYPLRILTWHEIVNDIVGEVPVAVTYCPLCNSAPVFERTVNGTVLEFGTTGKLKDSNLIMYDRQSESWWQQFTGEAIVGVATGEKLKLVPARLQSFGEFKAANPAGRVLVPNNENMRDYGRNPYVGYDLSGAPFLYDGQLPDYIQPMERVAIVPRDGSDPLVVTVAKLADATPFELEGHVFTFRKGQASALDQAQIAKGRDVGTVVVQKDGVDVAYDITFAFVAHAFHPEVEILQK